MLNILFGVFLAAALLNLFALGGSFLWSLASALISFALLVIRILFVNRIRAKALQLASFLVLAFLMLIGFWSGMKTTESGYLSYNASAAQIENMLEKREFFKAGVILDKLEKEFGPNDRLLIQKAQIATEKKNYNNAEAFLSMVANKQSDSYFTVLGRLNAAKEEYDKLQSTYVSAAKAYPLWSEAQRIAGSQAVNNKDYSVGEYFLLRAFEQVPIDPIPLYYIGVIRYEQGNYTDAEKYFSEALKLGISNEFAGYISWYRQEMGGKKQ